MRKRTTTLVAAAALSVLALAGQATAATSGNGTPAAAGTVAAETVKPGATATQTVYAPFSLERDQSLASDTARLVMQSDGNLVIYDEFGRARWATGTVGQGWRAAFQEDGNFVVYTRSGRAVWSSRTAGHPGSRLVVQDDGNVVIYDGSQAIWSSRTNH
ncbi:hypothetical protein ACSNOH_15490 [Streptomyces sp. URMC 127]|uniref:hypothetical protein n=1 Tax=Streptomyces sp. URMC 127 TaxID=3423402 RepID=UPI003F19B8D0